jgi:hypothetical protein
MSAAHKKALAEGRALSATVDRYLTALNAPKPRGRKISEATIAERLTSARKRAEGATGVRKVLAAQEMRDLNDRLARVERDDSADLRRAEAAFVKIAKRFSENRGIEYGAWRDVGVPVAVLRRAGITK